MPIIYTFGEAFDLLKYGKFTLLSFDVTIPAAKAVTIDEVPYTKVPPAVDAVYPIRKGWYVLTERFNWGQTSRPNKVYYELHQFGVPRMLAGVPSMWKEGFYCGAMVRESNIDNVCTHIYAAKEIHVKLWNATGAAPEDVYVDFTVWFYTFKEEFDRQVYELLTKKDILLGQIVELLKAKLATGSGSA